jgi:hypothetical protein
MKTEPQRTCPSCGNELSGGIEFCPVCMLRQALSGGVESGESSASEDTIKLLPEQAVQRFEAFTEPGDVLQVRIFARMATKFTTWIIASYSSGSTGG